MTRGAGWLVALVAGLVLLAGAPAAHAQTGGSVTVSIPRPAAGARVEDEFMVLADVQSTSSLQSVVAQIDDRQVPLVFTPADFHTPAGHRGTFSMSGLLKGQKTLFVTAIDAFGNVGQAHIPILYDAPPVLTILSPGPDAVAQPEVRLTATCTDETACTVEVRWNSTLLASAKSSLDAVVPIPGDGMLRFVARDSLGQTTSTEQAMSVNTNRHLVKVDEVSGTIFAVTPDRILFRGMDDQVRIKNRATGEIASVPTVPEMFPQYGYLTPAGAIFVGGNRVYDWRGGPPHDLGLLNGELEVEGDYAIWTGHPGPCCLPPLNLYRRELTIGTTVIVDTDVLNTLNDVAANGDVAYSKYVNNPVIGNRYEVFRYRDGTSQQLTNDGANNVYPDTDGVNVVYTKNVFAFALAMHDVTTETVLASPGTGSAVPERDYVAESGWVTFHKKDAGGVIQVWTRSPSGVLAQRSPSATESKLVAMNPAGEVLLINGDRLYFSQPGATLPVDWGPAPLPAYDAWRYVFFQGAQWLVRLGPSLFHISPVPLNVPAAPTGVTAAAGDTTATVNWTAPGDNGGSPITNYTVTAFQNGVAEKSVTVPAGSTSVTVTGLRNRTPHTFTVMAGSAHGNSAPSVPSGPVTAQDTPRPFAVFRPTNGYWFFQGGTTTNWGTTGDIAVPADYTGDGADDVAVYRPANGYWFVQGGPVVAWGTAGDDVPVPGDYNGDGTAEFAVFHPANATWFISGASSPIVWGATGDVPVPADYTGDGGTDLATFRPSTGQWFIYGRPVESWGTTGDIPVPGDHNGDGRAEIAVFRPSVGVWMVKDGATVAWGTNGDVPVQADYNGDGTTEFAVFRPSIGVWFVRDGPAAAWGTNGDVPVYVPGAIQEALFAS